VDSKFSYNILLGRHWLHDMDAVPSIVHGKLKFEYQDEVHIIIGDPKSYSLCNMVDMEESIMTYPRYDIVPLEVGVAMMKFEK